MGRFQHGVRWMVATGTTLGVAIAVGCSDDSGTGQAVKPAPNPAPSAPAPVEPAKPAEPAVDTRTPEQLVEAGRSAYNANCIACHSMNPAQDGALGPAVAGASLELLEARVVDGGYPEGYEPKRPSRVMIALPHLEPEIPALAAYLASVE